MMTTHHANKLKTAADQIGVIPVLTLFGNNIHTRIPMSQTLWDMSIDELDLTVRARNDLMRCGANTVGKVSELIMSDHGLGSVRNLGRKSISEIKTVLLAKGYEQLNAVERLKFWTQLYPMLLCGQPVAGETPWRLVCRPESMEGHDGLYGQKTRSKGSGEYSLSGAVNRVGGAE